MVNPPYTHTHIRAPQMRNRHAFTFTSTSTYINSISCEFVDHRLPTHLTIAATSYMYICTHHHSVHLRSFVCFTQFIWSETSKEKRITWNIIGAYARLWSAAHIAHIHVRSFSQCVAAIILSYLQIILAFTLSLFHLTPLHFTSHAPTLL